MSLLCQLNSPEMCILIGLLTVSVLQQPKSQPSGAVLKVLMTKEREERRNCVFGGPRHSNFCGMFVRVGKVQNLSY